MKWLVTWIVMQSFFIPCPQSSGYFDDYGRYTGDNITTSQACFDTRTSTEARLFDTYLEAKAFVDRAKELCTFRHEQDPLIDGCGMKDFKITKVSGGISN